MGPSLRATAFLTPLILVAGACRSTPKERAYIPALEGEWTSKAYSGNSLGKGSLVESVPADESFELWTRMVTIQYVSDSEETPRQMMERILEGYRARCPELVTEVIEEDEASILYEWRIDACPAAPDQHEIARLIRGVEGLHRLAFVCKGPLMPVETRAAWIATLGEAIVLREGQPIHVPPSAQGGEDLAAEEAAGTE